MARDEPSYLCKTKELNKVIKVETELGKCIEQREKKRNHEGHKYLNRKQKVKGKQQISIKTGNRNKEIGCPKMEMSLLSETTEMTQDED